MAMDADGGHTFLGLPPSVATALAALAEPVRRWFGCRYGPPTPAQRFAWTALTNHQHLLLSAPTGAGKTLAAFLPIISRLLDEPDFLGLRCLYVAPLRALIGDVRKTLRRMARELGHETGPRLRIGERTSDTPDRIRRNLWRDPPDILLTTPESLALLLSRPAAAELFTGLDWVVIDEVHSFVDHKRGADLSLSLERLTVLVPQLRRIGLSATCAPVRTAAHFLCGPGRHCAIGVVPDIAGFQLAVEPLPEQGAGFFRTLLDRLEVELAVSQTTLVFSNTRSLAERLTWALRRRLPHLAGSIAVHHSSLSPERRRRVELRLKKGKLRVVVSSTSLELGIDVSSVDSVVLVHPPGGVVRLLQRLGRSGHAPGRPRRGCVLTSSSAELLEAAVTGASGLSAQLEPLAVPDHPLDVLCQQLIGMAAAGQWTADEAFGLVRGAYPYRDLPRRDFDDCLSYLSGQNASGESWLPSRLRWIDNRFTIADERAARILRRNMGTIIADESRPVCLERESVRECGTVREWESESALSRSHALTLPLSHSLIGHVDEPFADRLQAGDRFLLDGRCLELRRIDGQSLYVTETGTVCRAPHWQGSGWPISADLAWRVYVLRVRAAEALREGRPALLQLLRHDYRLEEAAAGALAGVFERQECVSEIPDLTSCLIEAVAHDFGVDYYVHTPLNRAGNDAVARVAVRRLAGRHGRAATSLVADLGFQLSVGGSEVGEAIMRDVLAAPGFAADLDDAVADSWSLRERFRCAALTGLMLLRNPLGGRRRVGGQDWAERRLFDKVRAIDPDFVLLRQARHEVDTLVLDAAAAEAFLEELPAKAIHWRWLNEPSPFAEGWTQLAAGSVEMIGSPTESLERLHAARGASDRMLQLSGRTR
jgi:ATP-dependent Lhr-like helicase